MFSLLCFTSIKFSFFDVPFFARVILNLSHTIKVAHAQVCKSHLCINTVVIVILTNSKPAGTPYVII